MLKKIAVATAAFAVIATTAVAFPPAVIDQVSQNSVRIAGLDCRTQYRIQVAESDGAGGFGAVETHTPTTAACTTVAPVANFTISPNPAVQNQPVTFTSSGTCDATPCRYEWFHGSSLTAVTQIEASAAQPNTSASFTYTGPAGPRDITLRVTDTQNRVDTENKVFQLVAAGTPPPPTDTDGDGVPDSTDQCDHEPGPASSNGCPVTQPPSAGGQPDASNTGVPAGTTLTNSGSILTSSSGQVIDARNVTGQITVNHTNVTIRRTRVNSNAFDAIRVNASGLILEDSEITDTQGGTMCHNAIRGGGYTIRRSEMTRCENGADNSGNITVRDSWIHDLAAPGTGTSQHPDGSPHTDGIQGNGSNMLVEHNTIDPIPGTSGCTSGLIMTQSPTNWKVRDNWIDGRGCSYAVYAPRSGSGVGNEIVNNRLGRGYGYVACALTSTVPTFSGNTDLITGAALSRSQMDNGGGCSN